MANKTLTRFSTAIESAYSREPKPADNQADFDRWYPQFASDDYDTAIGIINRVDEPQLLDDMRDAYLNLFFKYVIRDHNVHFVRSDQTFLELFERCKKISSKKHDLLAEWATQLDDKKENPLKRRAQELSPTYQSKVRALIPKASPPPKTILDFLRDEFQKQHGYPPKSNADLYDFDPCPGETLKASLQGCLDSVQLAWNQTVLGNEDIPRNVLHGTLDGYHKYLADANRQGILQLFQIIKYLQDRIFIKRENMGTWTKISGGDTDPITCEMYAMACLQLLKYAQGDLVLRTNRQAFTPEERTYFLRPLREPAQQYAYYSNIEDRFTRQLGNVAAAFDLSKTFLDLLLLTKNQIQGATLVDLGNTHQIQDLWKPYRKLAEKIGKADLAEAIRLCADAANVAIAQSMAQYISLEVPLGEHNLDIAVARIGASPGVHKQFGTIRIVHMEPGRSTDFYIEYEELKPNLFLVHKDYITTKVYASRIFDMHKSTIGTIYVVQGMFMMMGFMPALVEAGLAGLIYEVAVWYASSKIADQVKEINPFFGQILEFALQVAMPRPNFGMQVVDPNPVTSFERPRMSVVEMKGAPSIQERGVRQADADWLATQLKGVEDSQRGVTRESSPVSSSSVVGESKPAPAGPMKDFTTATRERGEPPRPSWRDQRSQQQQTKIEPPSRKGRPASAERDGRKKEEVTRAQASKTGARPAGETVKARELPGASRPANENRPQEQLIEEAVSEVVKLEEAQIAAEEGEMLMAAQGSGRGSRPLGRGKVTSNQTRGTPKAARGNAGRGVSARGVPKPIKLVRSVMARLKINEEMQRFVIHTAEYYRGAMKRLERSTPDITHRSTIAHEMTRKQMMREFPHMVRGKQITGVSDTAVRESDAAVYDPTLALDRNLSGPVIELKAWAHIGKGGALRTAGGGYAEATSPLKVGDLEAVSSPQIQCYEVLMDELGVPVFVISGDGRIYTRDSNLDAWIQVDELETRAPLPL